MKEKLSITDKEKLLAENIKKLNSLDNYDVDMLINAYNHHLKNLYHYYGVIAKGKKDYQPSYNLGSEIKEGTLVYVNLLRGFPKELMDGHWCYVLKVMKCKIAIIPVTSIKGDDSMGAYEMGIDIKGTKKGKLRLQISDMRIVDKQRVYSKKGYRKVITPKKEIKEFLFECLG